MRTLRLLIADTSLDFCKALADALGGAFELRICHDGDRALELLESFQPDALLLDLVLPWRDGVCVLKAAAAMEKRPVCVITTGLVSPYVQMVARTYAVDYLMQKPCNITALAERIFDLVNGGEAAIFSCPTPGNRVRNLLLNLGFAAGGRRFLCVEEALACFLEDTGQSVTKELYPTLAKRLGISAQAVEKAIRTEIHKAWSCRNESVWRMYFRWDCCGGIPRPTNSAFLSGLAAHLQERATRTG